ncbi:MAG: methyltransferase [Ulvibacter sp.]|nr:methyltransferase [Ulvibacter sp.]
MSQQPFQFKKFKVHQDRCAMKVGTDGVLLGAWSSIEHEPKSILDIGAGTGVVALQLAQRSSASTIDAIEIDDQAHEQCTHNFENSDWADRLFCYHASVQEFASEMEHKYDLIVSNPPFFKAPKSTGSQTQNTSQERAVARFTDTLPFKHLVVCAAHLLSQNGVFCTILPHKEADSFIEIAAQNKLFISKICTIRGIKTSKIKRCMLAFSLHQSKPKTQELIIEVSRHNYTQDYKNLVRDFYVKM